MKRYLLLLPVLLLITHGRASAQDRYYTEDSTLLDMVNNFVKNTVMQYGKTRQIDSNELQYLEIMTVFLNGGAIDKGNLHMHSDGLLRKVGETVAASRERQVQDDFLKRYLGGLKVANVDELIKLMKQTSWNKDKPAGPPPEKQPAPVGKL